MISDSPTLHIRASAADRAWDCTESLLAGDGPLVSPTGEAAELGSAFHEWARTRHDGPDAYTLEEIVTRYGVDAEDLDRLVAYAMIAERDLRKWFVGATAERSMEYREPWDCPPYTEIHLTGTVDRAEVVNERGAILDYKTGRIETGYEHQQRTYAFLWLQENPDITEVQSATVHVAHGYWRGRTYTRKQLEAWWYDFKRRLANGVSRFSPGAHCFSGQTRILTDKGIVCLDEACDTQIRVLNRFGAWEDAFIRSFGRQPLMRMLLDDGTTIEATANHRWWKMQRNPRLGGWRMTDERLATTVVDRVPIVRFSSMPTFAPTAVAHGIVYGDGYLRKNRDYCVVRLQAHKAELACWFDATPVAVKHYPHQVQLHCAVKRRRSGIVDITMQPSHFKELPSCPSPGYARGFMAGLIATDGSVAKTGGVRVSCEGLARAKKIAEIARLGGIIVASVRVEQTRWPAIMPGGKPSDPNRTRELCAIRLIPATCPMIRSDQHARLKTKHQIRRLYREVVSVEPIGIQDTFCAVVPRTESFTLASGVVTSNCSYCPRRPTCPGVAAYHRSALATVVDDETEASLHELTADNKELLGPEVADKRRKVAYIQKRCEEFMSVLRNTVEEVGPVPAGDGKVLRIVPQHRQSLDTLRAWSILSQTIGQENLAEACVIKLSRCKEFVRNAAPKGSKGQAATELLAELVNAGAVSTTIIKQLREVAK